MARRTKIVASLGPASSSSEVIAQMIDAGMNVARVNMSHGKPQDHLEAIQRIREVAAAKNKLVGILADLPGPKIRTTQLGSEGVTFEDGSIVELKSSTDLSTAQRICTEYPTCVDDLEPGDLVTLGDGGVDMRVVEVGGDVVKMTVLNGGALKGRPGLHFPSTRVRLPVPTDEDRALIREVVLPANVDFVGVSFVRDADEIREVKELLGDSGIRVVAKIETPGAVDNIEEIALESDAVMVARGDLGTECPLEDVPVYQKRIIRACLVYSRPVITATQMLESMITASTPTRAEASDIANAVCDGTDAVMLSAESAVGHNPALAVETMARIAGAAEIAADYDQFVKRLVPYRQMHRVTAALTHGAWYAVKDANVKIILCCTRSGATAHAMAALRPEAKLVALSTSQQTVRQETLTWGVHSMALPETTNSDSMVNEALRQVEKAGLVQKGDVVAVLSGGRDVAGATNDLRLVTVGETAS